MYEDWSAGRITEYNFNMLSEKYQGEQKRELDVKIETASRSDGEPPPRQRLTLKSG
jgi:hypothetical protein